ncbi:hypothetical protein [Pseudomonas silesiensis]|uniref:hypothetical protein n=1 Tax=Pseudomonas silesiensis TaxID=1853130 RepID=UPI0030DAE7AC
MSVPPEIMESWIDSSEKAANGSEIMHRVGNDPEGSLIPTLSGLIPSIMEWMRQKGVSMDEEFIALLANTQYEVPLTYASGINVTRPTQTVLVSGIVYRPVVGALPFVTTTFASEGSKWAVLGDSSLRTALVSAGGSVMVGAPGAGTIGQALGMVSVAQYGGTGVGTETAAFVAACAQAVAQGHRRVFIPFLAFTVSAGTDCLGCELFGVDTDFSGRLLNHAGLHNIKVQGHNQSDQSLMPSPRIDAVPKLLWRDSTTHDYCIVQKRDGGYLLEGFVKDSTTTSESLATTTSEATRRRLSDVLNAIWAGVYLKTAITESGTWTAEAISNPVNVIPTYTSGRALNSRYTAANGSYAEFSVLPKDGLVQFALLTGTSSTATATVSINGTVVATITPAAAVSKTIKIYSIPASGFPDTQAVTVRLTHTGAAATRLQIIGFNFYELKDWRGQAYDDFAYFRNSAYAEYLTQSSANDAVIREYNSDKYGISYHGGETNIVSNWKSAGANVAPSVGGFVVVNDLKLVTSADVSWAAFGGGSIHIDATWHPSAGGVSHSAQISGDVIAKEIYSHMFGCPESFTEVVSPVRIDLAAAADGSRSTLGRSSQVVMRNPSTGQKITADLTLYNREQNQYGGIHIWKVVGYYLKMYYGWCLGGKMRITNLGLVSNYLFEGP